ncbi:helix-turn-helix transcriptional regulator [Mangrovihabitans endophyticus]|uniref:LuxR family transcriptional regulator n=1 Tax=Mangrovihabitans endophyticus TaxID=1751298 RepID=A0A8J3BWI5_9ACTN|nr:AAA family ATPase [Mangrovihabitans endophyticus]GGK84519.1 LuxR family transcriptional regulator [Mangrovihabitans endophyticus]
MTSEGGDAPLVGRHATLAAVRTDLSDAGPGGSAAVFVTGETGVGKTRVLTEIAAALRAEGAAVVWGTCLDIGDASPLHPVLHALRRLGRRPPEEDGDAGTPLDQVSRELAEVAGPRRLLLVLDDLQWADRSTRQLLLYLLAGLGELRLSVLAAVRAESLHGTHPLRRVLAELRRLRWVSVVDLAPLDRAQTAELVAAVAGAGVADEDAEAVFKRSGGNPFVAEELARDLRDGRVELSDTLREIFLSRVDELPPPAHAVVHAVAAGVEPVDHAVLARVVDVDGAELIDAVRVAVARRFLVSSADGYRLRHRLVAEVLAQEVLPAESAALHRRYAAALTAVGSTDHARLAHHWQRAGEPGRAREPAIAAARAAEGLYGVAEAHRYWTLALDLTHDEHADRTGLLGHAAEAAHRCGEHQRALSRLDQLAQRPDGPGECEIHLRRARYLAAAGRSATAETEYERALAAPACTAVEKASAAAYLAELLLHLGRNADAHARARVALDLAERDGTTADVVRASAALGSSAALREDPDAGLAVLRHAVQIAERDGSPEDVGCAYLHLAELLTGPLNSIEEGVLVARHGAQKLAALGGARSYQTRLLAAAGNGLFRVGQWSEAAAVVEAAMRHRPSGADAVELLLARCRLWVGFGDVEAAHRDLDAVATILAGGGARHVLPMLTLRAGLAMWQGRHAEARAAVQRGLTETRSDDLVLLGVLAWHGLRAEAEAQSGGSVAVDPGAVRRLRAVVDRMSRNVSAAAPPVRAVVEGYLDLCAAESSRIEQQHDPRPWARAAQSWDRRMQPYPAAYSRLRQAEAVLHQRSGRADAAGLLRAAYQTAQAMGARPFAAEIATVAARDRVALSDEPAPPTADERGDELAALTAREREVLGAVAEGLTNREIGQRLFISERTVGVHVGHIFDKLQVRTRVQASRRYLQAT